MTTSSDAAPRGWLSPLIHLSNNVISLAGVMIVTSAVVFWLFLLPATLRSEVDNPYRGILLYMVVPTAFICGLILIPAGILWRRRRLRVTGKIPSVFPPF